jgi:ribosomal protein S20
MYINKSVKKRHTQSFPSAKRNKIAKSGMKNVLKKVKIAIQKNDQITIHHSVERSANDACQKIIRRIKSSRKISRIMRKNYIANNV